jgi:hypothetical protein
MNYRPWYQRLMINPFAFTWSVFEYLYAKHSQRNPTLTFGIRAVDPPLEFNVESGRLNGVPLGADLEKLRFFGAADLALGNEADFSLDYASMGLAASFRARRLISFEIGFDSMYGEHPTKFAPCRVLTVRTASGVFRLSHTSTIDELIKVFGEPYNSDTVKYKYGVEKCLLYRAQRCRVVTSVDSRKNNLIYMEFSIDNAA